MKITRNSCTTNDPILLIDQSDEEWYEKVQSDGRWKGMTMELALLWNGKTKAEIRKYIAVVVRGRSCCARVAGFLSFLHSFSAALPTQYSPRTEHSRLLDAEIFFQKETLITKNHQKLITLSQG